jgi:hypothetical protein
VNVPETGELPWTVVKVASDGNWFAERVRVGEGTLASVAVTEKVTDEV